MKTVSFAPKADSVWSQVAHKGRVKGKKDEINEKLKDVFKRSVLKRGSALETEESSITEPEPPKEEVVEEKSDYDLA